MESSIAIQIENLNKTFKFSDKSQDSIREKFKGIFDGNSGYKTLRALRNVSITINKGDFYGIIGHNGSGKSTLLKLIIGALKPDKGSVINSYGKVLRLALGMGFDPNLSARHNIYVNGSIMGLTFREIGIKFHDILQFSGLEKHVDTPIKYYSSGMVSRLAFAIAMHVEADILLIDEFFGGVGDEAFRQKSSEKFQDQILKGRTIVFVSHEMQLIQKYCNRVCVLVDGEVSHEGSPEDVIPDYLSSFHL